MKRKPTIVLSSVLAGSLLVLASSAPAFAWGGPHTFGNNCSAYSIKKTSVENGSAGANTVDVDAAGYSLRVAFRGDNGYYTDIAPVTGTNEVITYLSQQFVSTYDVQGGYHTCGSSTTTT